MILDQQSSKTITINCKQKWIVLFFCCFEPRNVVLSLASSHFKASQALPLLCIFSTMLYKCPTQLDIASDEQFQGLHLFLYATIELTHRLHHRIAHTWGIVFHLMPYN